MEALTPGTKRFLRALLVSSLHPRKGKTEAREGKGFVSAPQCLDTELGRQQGPGPGRGPDTSRRPLLGQVYICEGMK